MRRHFLCALAVLVTVPLFAQNTDIEALSGLQFNFGNPGARALGMGGAFLGLADDASAAEANPAGLTILRKAELSLELRNYLEQQVLTTSGVYPDLERTGFPHYSDRVDVTFGSFVYPIKNKFTIGAYYHKPLRNKGAGLVIDQRNEFSQEVEKQVPIFYLPLPSGDVITEEECLRRLQTNPRACEGFGINPFISAIDLEQRTFGVAAAWQVTAKFSVGATARFQTFSEDALTFRVVPGALVTAQITRQSTGKLNDEGEVDTHVERDVTFAGGFKWKLSEKISVGGVYKQGPRFKAPTFFASSDTTNNLFIDAFPTMFHLPDIAGLGVSVQPIPVLTLNLDAVHITYSNLVDDFFSFSSEIRALDKSPYEIDNVTEIRLGGEYFFTGKVPFALRAGVWRDPAHSVEYHGPLNQQAFVAEAVLYPKGEDQLHLSIGAGMAWPRFQIDAAYDTSKRYKVGSISFVTRF